MRNISREGIPGFPAKIMPELKALREPSKLGMLDAFFRNRSNLAFVQDHLLAEGMWAPTSFFYALTWGAGKKEGAPSTDSSSSAGNLSCVDIYEGLKSPEFREAIVGAVATSQMHETLELSLDHQGLGDLTFFSVLHMRSSLIVVRDNLESWIVDGDLEGADIFPETGTVRGSHICTCIFESPKSAHEALLIQQGIREDIATYREKILPCLAGSGREMITLLEPDYSSVVPE